MVQAGSLNRQREYNLLKLNSIKATVTISTLTIFLLGIWSLTFCESYTLKKDMEHTLGEQQFSVEVIAKPFVIPECLYREYGFSSR